MTLLNVSNTTLAETTYGHVAQLINWFEDLEQARRWGGPNFRFPCSVEEFAEQVNFKQMASYSLLDQNGTLVGFGQFYMRLNRYHLARLVIAPYARNQGLGKTLIRALLALTRTIGDGAGYSLFVMQENAAAIRCYESLGFEHAEYPEAMPGNLDHCDYMVLAGT